jgi:hypothetical protein
MAVPPICRAPRQRGEMTLCNVPGIARWRLSGQVAPRADQSSTWFGVLLSVRRFQPRPSGNRAPPCCASLSEHSRAALIQPAASVGKSRAAVLSRLARRCPGRVSEQTRFRLRVSEEGSGSGAPASASGASSVHGASGGVLSSASDDEVGGCHARLREQLYSRVSTDRHRVLPRHEQ